ncbi:MAG: hypothetical protein HYR79_09405 [Nitrospirae bacterium]|nr:hypothetical protein [Nitrospirota bacterium]
MPAIDSVKSQDILPTVSEELFEIFPGSQALTFKFNPGIAGVMNFAGGTVLLLA